MKPQATAEQLNRAKELRKEAGNHYQREEDSFQRSDTDGCVSQWCSNLSARECNAQALILENGGYAQFNGLYDGNVRVAARQYYSEQFRSWSWKLSATAAAKYGRVFIPCGERSRVQKALGLCERLEWAPAWAKVDGSGKGVLRPYHLLYQDLSQWRPGWPGRNFD